MIIDPGDDPAPYLHLLREENWRLRGIVETHTHADHLAGHAPLHHGTGAPILLSRRSPAQFPHTALSEGESLRFGREEIVVLETPGHTPDHLTLQFRDKIFTGDTLLIGGCGRTDLGGREPGRSLRQPHGEDPPAPGRDGGVPRALRAAPRARRAVQLDGRHRADDQRGAPPAGPRRLPAVHDRGWPPKPADFDRIVAANLAEFPG